MAKIAKQLTELIGNTPLLELTKFNTNNHLAATIIAKLESFNPAGCVKERIALAMIEEAEAKFRDMTKAWYVGELILRIPLPI